MHLLSITAATLLSLSAIVVAAPTDIDKKITPLLQINNYCPYTLFISDGNETSYTPPLFELKTGTAYVRPIVGQGNVMGISRTSQYYTVDAPKLILGTTISSDMLWWTVAPLDGDPFQGAKFNITTPKKTGCGTVTGYDGMAHNCKVGKYDLTFNPCFEE